MKSKQYAQKGDQAQDFLYRIDRRFKQAFISEIKSNYPVVLRESTIVGCFPASLSVEIYFFPEVTTEAFCDTLFKMVKTAFRKSLLPTINTLYIKEIGWNYFHETVPGTITFYFEILWVELPKEIYINGSRAEVQKRIIFYVYNLCAQRSFLYECYERILSSCKIATSEEFSKN